MFSKNIRYFAVLLLVCLSFSFIVPMFPVTAADPSPFSEEARALEIEDRIALYLSADNVFESAEAKIETMKKGITRGDYTLYVDTNTAEVAVKNNRTGQILMTNPYDLASTTSIDIKEQLMSQVVVEFEDLANSGVKRTFYSFDSSAQRGQVEIKNIKNGLRVDYTLGKQTARRLLPRWIEATRFETLLQEYIKAESPTNAIRFGTFYGLKNVNDSALAESVIKQYNQLYPCTKNKYETEKYGDYMAIYVIDANIVEREENMLEGWIKQFCPHYNYESLEYDHALTQYVGDEKSPAIFRLAVEYYLSSDGLKVTVPANGIRFDEDYYRLRSISVLPYFGASANDYTGYTFIPDGSGAIIRNEDIMSDGKNTYTVTGQIYGADFAYHTIKGFNGKSEVMRLPVWGIVEDTVSIKHNFDNQVGCYWSMESVTTVDPETGVETPEYYTSEDRIMIDAVDASGILIQKEEDYWNRYQYTLNDDGTYTVITSASDKWNSAGYSIIEDVETYNTLRDEGLVPYYEAVEFYLMTPLVKTKLWTQEEIDYRNMYGLPIEDDTFVSKTVPYTKLDTAGTRSDGKLYPFDYVSYSGNKVYIYVDEAGEPVDEADRVEGILKIREQLYYNGEPAFYNTNVPVDPDAVIEGEGTEGDVTEGEGTEGEGTEGEGTEGDVTEGEGTEGEGTEGDVTEGEGTEGEGTEGEGTEGEGTEGEGDEDEDKVVIEYYNDVAKTEEKYDNPAYEEIETIISQGVFAVITEGDSLAQITSSHGAKNPKEETSAGLHKYNSVYASFFPRPQDSYRLSDAISVGSSDEWTVVSDRKYTGCYTIEFTMLSNATYTVENADGSTVTYPYEYEASYVGMANVYRDYLVKNEILTKLENVEDDIPLYLELLGMTEVEETILTIPVMMDTALTSFKDVKSIYESLSKDGIDNIRARLIGFTKNGMFPLAPSAVKFEKVVGGNKGYVDMVSYCDSVTSLTEGTSLKIYPDFDFANLYYDQLFDGVSSYYDTVKTIDDRYAGKREYDATYQSFQRVGAVCIAPEAYQKIYKKFDKKISKLGVSGISASTLGTDLNSDFDEDEPYNREDNKQFTTDLLEAIYEDYGKIMIDGGNAYALKYASDILYMSLDSSLYMRASASVPFLGMVLHGYVNYAGDPTNTAGDIYYETLKIIENGASPYFILAYKNTSAIKENGWMSDYYAVDYNIWREDIVEVYNKINGALGDLQDATITAHTFVDGVRDYTENELIKAEAIRELALASYDEVYAAAVKDFENKKALAERHGEEFTELFSGLYPYLTSATTYGNYMYREHLKSINTSISDTSIVCMTYTKPSGENVTFILNYNSDGVTVELDGESYSVSEHDFIRIDN